METPQGQRSVTMRRVMISVVASILVLAAMMIVWSIAYAAVTGIAFKTSALISTLTKSDPFVSFKHVAYYWSSWAVRRNALIAAGGTLALFTAGWISLFVIKPPSIYGDARFARGGDLFRANLHAREGLILGWHGSSLLRNNDPRHPLVTGPTRSGKGRGFVIPNLLAWGGSTITLDLKQENFRETAGARRAADDEVYMFAPGSARSHCYNPLEFMRRGPEKITDLTNVAHFLIPDPKTGEAIWSQKARDLFVGVLGYVMESKLVPDDARTIRTAIRVLSTGRDIGKVLAAIVKVEGQALSSFVVGRFNQIIAEPADTRGSVLANLTTALAPWDNPLIAGVTSRSDFDIRELRRKRMSIYIGPPPSDLESYRSLIRLLVQQIHDALMRELPGPEDRYDVLVMLDEFRQLQRMDAIVEKIPISAGYGFRMAIVIQNMSQLDEIYGKATREGIVANCALKLFVAVDDLATANYVSDQLGNRTVTTTTTNFRRGNTPLGERSVSKSLTGVPLMRADEVIRLPKQNSILMIANERPILTKKIRYDKDRLFRRLAGIGKSTFRSVPDVPTLDEPPLAILTKDYGRAPCLAPNTIVEAGEETASPAEKSMLSGLQAPSSEAERPRMRPARTQPELAADAQPSATVTAAVTSASVAERIVPEAVTEHERPDQEETSDAAPRIVGPEVRRNNVATRSKMASDTPASNANVEERELGTTIKAERKRAVLEDRSMRRQKDTLSGMFGVDGIAEIYQEVRAGSTAIMGIAEMIERRADTAIDSATRDEARVLVVELDRAARASRLTDSGDLEDAD
jgi:type IV secretion system protein VirD4